VARRAIAKQLEVQVPTQGVHEARHQFATSSAGPPHNISVGVRLENPRERAVDSEASALVVAVQNIAPERRPHHGSGRTYRHICARVARRTERRL
jgi:hypothetical protein